MCVNEYLIWMILEGESSKSSLHLLFRWLLEQTQHPRVVLPLPPHIAPKLPILLTGGISLLPSAKLSVIRAGATHGPALSPIHSAFCSIHDPGSCFPSVSFGDHIVDKEFCGLPFLSFHKSSFHSKMSKGLVDHSIHPTQGFHTLYCIVLLRNHQLISVDMS